jgi:acetyltransferase-like isoleucine patch superfamily enzyme
MKRTLKAALGIMLSRFLRITRSAREAMQRIYAYSLLAADINRAVPASVVVLGPVDVHGVGNISLGEDVLLYPGLYLETQEQASITIGDGVVMSRGVHVVAMAGVTIGAGSMIGEYTSIRDANHNRSDEATIRNAGHTAKPIVIGREVWIGRGVTVLGGVEIGDGATVGANAVVTRNVAPGAVVAGVPAEPIVSRKGISSTLPKASNYTAP